MAQSFLSTVRKINRLGDAGETGIALFHGGDNRPDAQSRDTPLPSTSFLLKR